MCQYVELSSSSSSSSYATSWMLVHAYVTSSRKVRWSGPHHTIKMLHFVLFHSVTCDTNSLVSCTHVNTTKLCNVTCTLVATCVILRSLECITTHSCETKLVKFTTPSFIWLRHSILRHLESPFCHMKEVVHAKIPSIYVCTSKMHPFSLGNCTCHLGS